MAIFFLDFVIGDRLIAIPSTLGFLVMFSFYEYTHWSFNTKPPKTKLGLKLRKHHLCHHFQSPKMNHGVTSTFMDKALGTYLEPGIVKVPKSVAMPWLLESGKQTLNPKWANNFQLR